MSDVFLTFARGDGSEAITFDIGGPYYLLGVQGLSSTSAEPVTVKAPGKVGERAFDSLVSGRTVSLQIEVNSDDIPTHWADRERLTRAMAAEPLRDPGDAFGLGELRLYRGDAVVLALPAFPRQAPADTNISPIVTRFDCELFAPDPYWRELVERVSTLETAIGFTWPLTFPLTMPTNNTEITVANLGQVATPLVVRWYGDLEGPRLTNESTGEVLEFTTAVAADEYLEVSTEHGNKYAELVDPAGTRTNVMGDLNLAMADFFWLRPGEVRLRFEAAVNNSGRAIVTYRQRYAGV